MVTDPGVFGRYGRYYDLLYRDKGYAAEAEYVHRLIQRWRPGARDVLEMGSGTGKHAALLSDQGYSVHGVDLSDEMVSQSLRVNAQQLQDPNGRSTMFSSGDIRSVRLGRTFDAAISLFHVVSYQVSNADIAATFQTASAHLNTGGIFLFDAWYGPTVLTDRPAVRVKRVADDQIEVTRLAEPVMRPNTNVVDVNYHVFVRDQTSGTVTELRETHEMRYLFRPEVELFAATAGFAVLHAEEWLTGRELGFDTWAACFILRCL